MLDFFYTEAKHSNLSSIDTSWALGIIAGAIGTLVAVAIVALLARKRHHRPLQYEGNTYLLGSKTQRIEQCGRLGVWHHRGRSWHGALAAMAQLARSWPRPLLSCWHEDEKYRL